MDGLMPTKIDSALPALLLQSFHDAVVFDASGARLPLASNVSLAEAETLYKAVRDSRPEVSVEIGFAQGISALAILQGLEDNAIGTHHIIDPFQSSYDDAGLAMVELAELSSRMVFHRSFADEVIPQLPTLDFAFIDSSHLFDLTVSEFVMVDRKLRVAGLIAFHDMWMPSLQRFLRYVLANRSYEIVRNFDGPEQVNKKPHKSTIRSFVSSVAGVVPYGERIFQEDFIRPWERLRVPNLVILRKTAEDQREWTYHKPF